MSKVDWSLAPEWAKGYGLIGMLGLPVWFDEDRYEYLKSGKSHLFGQGDTYTFACLADIERRPAQPKPWSGPEDGLPPVNTECEVETNYGVWEHGVILCHGYDDFKPHAVAQCASGLWMEEVNGFRAIETPEQQAADTRETAIRELMDIAQVDCRVTAARLVDAGFKREVV